MSRLGFCVTLCLLSALGFGQTGEVRVPEKSPAKYQAPPPEFFNSNTARNSPVIAAGDVLNIRFFYTPDLNKIVKVREDGKVSLDLFQGVQVAGLTPEDLQKKLVELYSREFTNPEITVDFESRANNSVFVTGEVLLPGAKEIKGDMTVGMALALGQVNLKTAGPKSVFLMRKVEDNKYRVYKLDASFPNGTANVIQLTPGDILFVPRKGIVKADDFIEQYARQLLPVTPSAGVYVAP
jgi:protein involved in polysaccharide export with SLBB domain